MSRAGIAAPLGRRNGFVTRCPRHCPSDPAQRAELRNDTPLALNVRPKGPASPNPAQRTGTHCPTPPTHSTQTPCGPTGRSSLSPAHRAGFTSPQNSCGLKGRDSLTRACSHPRTPNITALQAVTGFVTRYPGRCPGLKNEGPSAQGHSTNGASSPSPVDRPDRRPPVFTAAQRADHPSAQLIGLGTLSTNPCAA